MENEITPEQKQAIERFARCNGRFWKSALRHAWETGKYDYYDGVTMPALQQVRNNLGPSWLVKFRLESK